MRKKKSELNFFYQELFGSLTFTNCCGLVIVRCSMGWIIRIRILIFDFMVILSTISCFYRKSEEEVDMDKVTAAMVLTSLSTSPLVRSPPVKVSGKSSVTSTSYLSPHEIIFTLSALSCRNGLLYTLWVYTLHTCYFYPVFTVTCAWKTVTWDSSALVHPSWDWLLLSCLKAVIY